MALAQQPQVLAARAQTDAAQGVVEQVRSPFLPQVTATGQYTRETGNYVPRPGVIPNATAGGMTITPTTPTTSLSNSFDFWNFGISATQLIYDFGQTYGRYSAARDTVEQQRLTEKATAYQVISTVRSAYFSARQNRELVEVARETLTDQQRHLTQVQGFVQVGTQPAIALAQQSAAVANAQVQVIVAENNYALAKAQLNQAAGLRGGIDYDVGDENMGPIDDEDQPLDVLLPKALAARPEIASLNRQRQAQEATVRSFKGGYGPTFFAGGSFTGAGTSLSDLVPNWQAYLLLTWPIFQGGLTYGQVHQAEALLSGVDAQTLSAILQVQLQVDGARLAVRAAKASIGAAEQAATSAREQLRLAEQRYATGVGSIIELNDAQVTSTTAAAQEVQARYSLASARAQLLAALGRT
jgi:outer membrane protein